LDQTTLSYFLNELEAGFQSRYDALTHQANKLLTNSRPRESENLHDKPDDAAQIPLLRHLHTRSRHWTSEPCDHTLSQMREDIRHELANTLPDSPQQVAEKTNRVADNDKEGVASSLQNREDARPTRAHHRFEDQLK